MTTTPARMSKRFVRATNRCVACWGMAPTHSVASTNLAISAHCAPSSGGRKGAAHARAGQALRGSSEFHAWGDSNLYLRRVGEQLTLTVEHRAAASITGITLALAGDGDGLALCVTARRTDPDATSPLPSAEDRVARTLAEAAAPLTVAELRRACRMRTSTLCAILSDLVMEGRVRRTAAGYLPAGRWRFLPRVSRVSLQRAGNGNGKSIGKRDWDAINERAHAHIPKNRLAEAIGALRAGAYIEKVGDDGRGARYVATPKGRDAVGPVGATGPRGERSERSKTTTEQPGPRTRTQPTGL